MWDKVDRTTHAFISTESRYWTTDENTPVPDTSDVIWLKRIVDDTEPVFNPATQKLVRTIVDDFTASTRTAVWTVVSLTQEELDAKTEAAQDLTRKTQAQSMLAALENGTITAAQQRQILAFLLRRELKR